MESQENKIEATEAAKTTAPKKPAAKKSAAASDTKPEAKKPATPKKPATAKPAAAKSATAKSAAAKKTPPVKEEAETKEVPEVKEAVAEEPVAVSEPAPEVKEEVKAEAPAEPAPEAEAVVAETPAETPAEEAKENAAETAEEKGEFVGFDDEAERQKELQAREAKVEADAALPPDPEAVLEVRHLKKYFTLKKSMTGKPLSVLKAVDDVSFKIYPGETLGIVGESGCGKTTMGRTVLKLHQPTAGQIFFNGVDIAGYKPKEMRKLRTEMQIVFQDPYSSLPPRSTVGGILAEAVKVHNIVPPDQIKDYVLQVMDKCGLRDYYYERYPHEFSGGQRQRICIARALVVNPKLVVCDEPVSALDVSIQAQIINLLKNLQQERQLTYLFISHDLSVVKYISDKIGVMYLGSMVEFGEKEKIFGNPMHPYTVALFSAVPNPNPDEKVNRIILKGEIPSPANPPMGCKFHTRCPKAMEVCKHIAPVYKEYEPGHFVACHCYSQED